MQVTSLVILQCWVMVEQFYLVNISKSNQRLDIQFKGSGDTFSRKGDGRAALGLTISEAMHSLNIPTTRSLAVVETEKMIRENHCRCNINKGCRQLELEPFNLLEQEKI